MIITKEGDMAYIYYAQMGSALTHIADKNTSWN